MTVTLDDDTEPKGAGVYCTRRECAIFWLSSLLRSGCDGLRRTTEQLLLAISPPPPPPPILLLHVILRHVHTWVAGWLGLILTLTNDFLSSAVLMVSTI